MSNGDNAPEADTSDTRTVPSSEVVDSKAMSLRDKLKGGIEDAYAKVISTINRALTDLARGKHSLAAKLLFLRNIWSLRPADLPEPDVEPWPVPVNGADLLDELATAVRRFIVLTEAAAHILALWISATFLFDLFEIFPRLAILSPVKRCGKSTLFSILGALVRRPEMASSISAAALYRLVQERQPTLLLDEADALFAGDKERAEAVRGILNAGHRSDGVVRRCHPKTLKPESFKCFAPTAVAAIKGLPETLIDRSLIVVLHRRKADEVVDRCRRKERASLGDLARKCARWANDNRAAVQSAYESDLPSPEGLTDREADNLESIFAIAQIAGGPWPERARAAALSVREPVEVQAESTSIELLTDVSEVLVESGKDRIATRELLESLAAMDSRPWATLDRGRPINSVQLARMLRPFGVTPGKPWKDGGETIRGYYLAPVLTAQARYVPDRSSHPQPETEKRPETAIGTDSAVSGCRLADVEDPDSQENGYAGGEP